MRRLPVLLMGLLLLGSAACTEHPSPLETNHDALRISASLNSGEADYLQEQIKQLYTSRVLTRRQANTLNVKINAAQRQLARGNVTAAETIMTEWRNQLNALVAEGVLTDVQAGWLLRIASGAAAISDTYDYAGFYWNLGIPEFQYARGTLTLEWLDRNAGTFTGQFYRESRGSPDMDFVVIRTMEVRNGVFHTDGTFYFDAILLVGTTEVPIPHAGTFDGTTLAGPVQNSTNIRFVATK
jgi:hypothetical protein